MIKATKYAIGFTGDESNKELWLINALHGSNDVIDAALEYIVEQRESEERTI